VADVIWAVLAVMVLIAMMHGSSSSSGPSDVPAVPLQGPIPTAGAISDAAHNTGQNGPDGMALTPKMVPGPWMDGGGSRVPSMSVLTMAQALAKVHKQAINQAHSSVSLVQDQPATDAPVPAVSAPSVKGVASGLYSSGGARRGVV
jgi:hypothetical protein